MIPIYRKKRTCLDSALCYFTAGLIYVLLLTPTSVVYAVQNSAMTILGQYCLSTIDERRDPNLSPRFLGPWVMSSDGNQLAYWVYRDAWTDPRLGMIGSALYALWMNGKPLQAEANRFGLQHPDMIGQFAADSSRFVYTLGPIVDRYLTAASVWANDARLSKEFDNVSALRPAPVGNSVAYIVTTNLLTSAWHGDKLFLPEFDGTPWDVSASANGLNLAHVRRDGNGHSVWLNETKLSPKLDFVKAVALSPDGKHVAYVADSTNSKDVVWLNSKRLTTGFRPIPGITSNSLGLLFSRDGSKVFFIARGNKGGASAVWENDKQLSPEAGPISILNLELAADGKSVVYLLQGLDRGWSVYVNGEQRSPSFVDLTHGVALSPDGKDVAFAGPEGGPQKTPSWGVWREKTLLEGSLEDARSPVFSPDGRRLVYLAKRSGKWALHESGKRLGDEHDDIIFHGFSPDGQRLFVIGKNQGRVALWVNGKKTSSDFEDIKNVETWPNRPRYLVFSADGTRVGFIARSQRREAVWVEDRKVSPDFPAVMGLALSRDGKHVAYSAQQASQWANEPATWAVWIDGKKHTRDFTVLERFTLSADGNHILYVAGPRGKPRGNVGGYVDGEQTVWLDDRRLSPTFDHVSFVGFGSEYSQAYYVASNGARQSIWRDGRKVAPAGERSWEQFREITNELSFSPDGSRIGFVARRERNWEVWANDKVIAQGLFQVFPDSYSPMYDSTNKSLPPSFITFDATSEHVTFRASQQGGRGPQVWRDATALSPTFPNNNLAADLRFVSRSSQVRYAVSGDYWLDGKLMSAVYPGAEAVTAVADSADGKTHLAVVRQSGRVSVWRNHERVSPQFDTISWLEVNADGSQIALAASNAGKLSIWVNGRRVTPEFDSVKELLAAFTLRPDGKTVAYTVLRGNKYRLWINEKPIGQEIDRHTIHKPRLHVGPRGEVAHLGRTGEQDVLYLNGVPLTTPQSQLLVAWDEFSRSGQLTVAMGREKMGDLLHVRIRPSDLAPAAFQNLLQAPSTCFAEKLGSTGTEVFSRKKINHVQLGTDKESMHTARVN